MVHGVVTSPNHIGNGGGRTVDRQNRKRRSRRMSLGRIQITMSDDPHSQALLTSALASQRVWSLLTSPRATGMTGDVIVELPPDVGLAALLSELHMNQPAGLGDQRGPAATPCSNSTAAKRPSGHGGHPVATASTGRQAWPAGPSLRELDPHCQLGNLNETGRHGA